MLEANRVIIKNMTIYAMLAVCVYIVLLPLASGQTLPNLLDYFRHLGHIVEAGHAIDHGQYILRTTVEGRHGWYYPLFQFYSPTGYLIAGGVYHWIFPGDPYLVYKVTIGLFLWIGACYLYRLAEKLTQSALCSYASALIYLFSPYTLIVVDHIGGFNEALAIGVVPVVVFYSVLLFENGFDYTNALKLMLAWYVLITTHLLTFLITVVSLVCIFSIAVTVCREGFKRFVIGLGLLAGGMGLAAWYLVPILQFNAQLMINKTFDSYGLFKSFLPALQTLFSPFALYATSNAGTSVSLVSTVQAALGSMLVFSFFLASYCLGFRVLKPFSVKGLFLGLYLTVIGLFLLMYSPLPFWDYLPEQTLVIQYSWRLLAPLTWMSALLFALCASRFIKSQLKPLTCLVVTAMIILPSLSWLHAEQKVALDKGVLNELPALLEKKSIVEDYLLDVKKSVSIISFVDSIVLMKPTVLDSIERIHLMISKPLLQSAFSPFIDVHAFLKDVNARQPVQINAFLGAEKIATYKLFSPTLHWQIPLSAFKQSGGELHFAVEPSSTFGTTSLVSTIHHISLAGFLSAHTIQTVAQMASRCHRLDMLTECEIEAMPGLQWLELPLLYYPGLLDVRINGMRVPYYGVLYQDSLVTAVKVLPDQLNKVTFTFVGSLGSNYFSLTLAALLLMVALYLYLRKVFYSSPNNLCN